MKKITLFAAVLVAVSFASCKKDRTCACLTSSVNAGTNYSSEYDNSGNEIQVTEQFTEVDSQNQETVYTKISKNAGKENCPASSVTSYDYDYTYNSSPTILGGNKGKVTNSTACELK